MSDMTHKDVMESNAICIDGIEFVKVVRCKNCIHSHHDEILGFYWCDGVPHHGDFFCAIGERISNETLNGAPFRKNANSAPLTP